MQEEELIEACKKGERLAQRALYAKYSSSMFAVAMRYAKSQPEAEDILQDAFIKIFEKISTFKGSSTLGAWIKRIVINTALNSERSKLYMFPMSDVDDTNYFDDRNVMLSDFQFKDILGMIQKLPRSSQIIFNLYVIEGYNHLEIANELGISEGTSKSQLSRAKKMLRKLLTENGQEVGYGA
ncbi:DNA-directed RNA polymerase sigma-70 factor [Aureibacter tunicatorum]|nr:DNA-directed RNA polymerase sigma-70 factor [Aureibacter tunicatorum]